MIQRSYVTMISWLTTALCLLSKQARAAEDVPYGEQPPPSVWDTMALRVDVSYARAHVFDVPFRGAQLWTTIGVMKGPLTGFLGSDFLTGSTEAGLGVFAEHFYVGGDVQLWRFRLGAGVFSGFSMFSRASGSSQTSSTMSTVEMGVWGDATFDVVRLQSGRLPIALVIGARGYVPFATDITWSPAVFAGVHL